MYVSWLEWILQELHWDFSIYVFYIFSIYIKQYHLKTEGLF